MNTTGRQRALVLSSLVAMAALAACDGSTRSTATDEGVVSFALAAVPNDVACLTAVVRGAREATRTFDATAGQPFSAMLSALPTGDVTFAVSAFPENCAGVGPATEATWSSDPVALTLSRGVPVNVRLVMRHNGRINVDLDWEDLDAGASRRDAGTPVVDAGPPPCEPGRLDCDRLAQNGCEVDPATNANHCGACGLACNFPLGEAACVAGQCQLQSCQSGFGDCNRLDLDGCERDLRVDGLHCGRCENVCPAPANGRAACVNGSRTLGGCTSGFADCDGVAANGCETNLAGSVAHCGACGRTCSFANALATCSNGACALLTCNAAFGNCDGDAANGCETSLGSVGNCGRCGASCPTPPNGSATCQNRVCGVACSAGFGDCDFLASNGCETNLATSAQNCGACGAVCAPGLTCAGGRCLLARGAACTSAQACASGFCVDGVCCQNACTRGGDSQCVRCNGDTPGICENEPNGRSCDAGVKRTGACMGGICQAR